MLKVQFHKSQEKSVVLKCIREDGSTTWSKVCPNMEYHDLAHIAIEEVLNFRNSFYGLVHSGFDIQDFELPEDQKSMVLKGTNLYKEAIITEHLVNLLTVEKFNGSSLDFIHQINQILKEHHLPFPEKLNKTSLALIRNYFDELIHHWQNTPNNSYFEKVISYY